MGELRAATRIEKFSGLVKGSITGFDRIVCKGFILPLLSARQVMQFCTAQGVLNKEYKSWMMAQTMKIIDHAEQYAKDNCGNGIPHLPSVLSTLLCRILLVFFSPYAALPCVT